MHTVTIDVFAPVADPNNDPLTAFHRRQLAVGRERSQCVRRVARVASFNGWVSVLMAALSMPFAMLSPIGLAITAGLFVVAYNEFRGRRRILSFDPAGATFLGWNQLGLLAMIVAYCAWSLYTNLTGPSALEADPETYAALESALGSLEGVESLYRQIVILVYGTVIVLSVVFQGGNALYYFSRREPIAAFVEETPEWVRDLLSDDLTAPS
jgi:hypothetical protein